MKVKAILRLTRFCNYIIVKLLARDLITCLIICDWREQLGNLKNLNRAKKLIGILVRVTKCGCLVLSKLLPHFSHTREVLYRNK